jgi:L-fucose isomerase-like protein
VTQHFSYRIIASPLHEALDRVVAPFVDALSSIGGRAGESDASLILVATGGTERQIIDWWEQDPQRPVFMIAHPGHNSLPASLESLARLQQLGARGHILYLRSENDVEGLKAIETAAKGLAVRAALRNARLGRAGVPSDWLVASTPTPETVRATWGPMVVDVALDSIYEEFSTAPPNGATELHDHAHHIEEPSPAAIQDAARLTVALERFVDDNSLTAVSVRCFDLLGDIETSGCVALSELNDEGIVAGCEGDVVSTVGIMWARELTSEMPWMANPAQVDVDANRVLLAHCTVPRSIVDSYALRSHFESGSSVGIQGTIPPGPVTLLRIGGIAMDELWLAEGEVHVREPIEGLCRTQMDVHLSRGSVSDLLERPLGNHIVAVMGHHADELHSWWKTFVA